MNKSSIYFSITVTFIALFAFTSISFVILYDGSKKREEHFSHKRTLDIAHSIRNDIKRKHGITKELVEHLEFMDFTMIEEKSKILKNPNKIRRFKRDMREHMVYAFELDKKNYIYIKNPRYDILLLDNYTPDNFRTVMIFLFIAILFAFALLYLNTMRKLKPLRTLKKSIKNMGEEEFDTLCMTHKKDEISQLSNEFYMSAKKLKALKESRNVFIRNIMHELKTPITKGQFLAQLPSNDANKQSMQKVFYRLESLINEFASIEELISTKEKIEKKEYLLSDIVDNAMDLLLGADENVNQKFEEITIKVNFKLFSIAVKNLMDNAIKYSTDKKATIKTHNSSIIFQNRGERLKYSLNEYFEPFFKDGNTTNQSFGLGLYIVKHILDAHELTLQYEHENKINKFIIT